ncbi:hypothetical protein ASPWEDRAFT_110754 [Aspergillus wentii DTO 134E9]|uniref:Uncharacterized protein n=1 Tax=Aspergillus wentii DTO 134E9 TaxID=1073089 RepID=A0A1L9RL39_ASPWE|nr:uncharacterized protein ASPWEDRAFT_110754 [Aspergillus wentii DTO 134E9]OJJ35650.1 hypothetical protein ASPWEDRAFT_110754 [Aspergillus wentii DTO 134E9]
MPGSGQQGLVETVREQSVVSAQRSLSTFERVITTNAPILESLLLQAPTDSIFKLYHTSRYLRSFLRSYPTAWKYLSFRLYYPSGTPPPVRVVIPGSSETLVPRQSRPYALDQLLMNVVVPFSPILKSLELDNTAVSGQILISTVLHSRRETLEHLSVRGCKNVSLKYHIIPYLTMFGLQYDVDMETNSGTSTSKKHLALKSLYTYRCRHHRRRPYLSSSLVRKDSDSEPTHELVNLCHKLGIWTDTTWCSTPAGRCYRRRGYVSMRVPQGSAEVWVVFDRLWRSKNWIGPIDSSYRAPAERDGKVWEHGEFGNFGEALGTGEGDCYGEGKTVPAHLRHSHTRFVENIRCDNCLEDISERCEQCSILMHCVGCRKTLCASCAYDRPYSHLRARPSSEDTSSQESDSIWWAPGATVSPCVMQDPLVDGSGNETLNANGPTPYPNLKFHWCCTEPIFSGGGGISIGTPNRDVDHVRAVPLPRGKGWEDLEYTAHEWSKTFPKYAYGDPKKPDYSLQEGHIAMMRWLLGPPDRKASACPRNLCQSCYDTPQWKVHCKSCSKPLCIEHDLRGLRLRICGYRDLALEKIALQTHIKANPQHANRETFVPRHLPQTDSMSGFELPYRTQRLLDSTTSSFTEEHPAEGSMDATPPASQNTIDQSESSVPMRRRSFSGTNSNRSGSSSPTSVYCEAPLEMPKWQGCQSFFCPQYRALGDQRQRCASVLRECTRCSVNVCQDCINDNPPCNCSYCSVNYLCPNCLKLREQDGTCRRQEEERARREQKWKRDMQALEGILEVKLANEVAEYAGQFFDTIEQPGGVVEEVEDIDHDEFAVDDSFHDMEYAQETMLDSLE